MPSPLEETLSQERVSYDEEGSARRRDAALNDRFIELYIERSSSAAFESYFDMLKSCYVDAGFSQKNNGLLYSAKQALRRNWPQIEEELRQRISGGSAMAINTLIQLCTNGRQEAVKLKAAVELLNKGGFAEIQRVQVSSAESMSDEELAKQIREAMAVNGLKVVKEG